jgi:hypothetical protein
VVPTTGSGSLEYHSFILLGSPPNVYLSLVEYPVEHPRFMTEDCSEAKAEGCPPRTPQTAAHPFINDMSTVDRIRSLLAMMVPPRPPREYFLKSDRTLRTLHVSRPTHNGPICSSVQLMHFDIFVTTPTPQYFVPYHGLRLCRILFTHQTTSDQDCSLCILDQHTSRPPELHPGTTRWV